MALEFIPEDGTGVSGANSYLTVDEFIDLSELLGYDASDIDYPQIEKRLIRAAIILDSRYRDRFPGYRAYYDQGLEWPRTHSYYVDHTEIPSDIVPKEVKMAIVEIVNLIGTGATLQPTISAQGNIKSERVRADVVEEAIEYHAPVDLLTSQFTQIDDALSRITGGWGNRGFLRIVRVGGNG